ncbi:hypothetical protein [Pedobacter ginsengisoli]|uniref:hypothetical protein n=1 Tax=Pedobacter ginsengisoli TaxID=363852 RepID=UPI00254C682A|nr:hypothetical protein [Pedobacter ginsengisoli]
MRNYSGIAGLKFEVQDGLENPSGIKEQAYLFWRNSIETEALPSAVGTTAASIVTITTDHILKDGTYGIPCQPMYEKSGLAFKLAGEVGSKIMETDIELFVPQVEADAIGGIVSLKNFRGILFIRRPSQTTGFIQVGSKEMTLKMQDIPGGLGTGPGGEVGYKLTLKAYDFTPWYVYEGDLPEVAP